MDTSIFGGEDSSFVSFMLDQEEYTLEFGPDTTIQSIEDGFKNATYTEVEFNHCPNIPVDALCELIPFMNSSLKSLIIRNTPWLNDECIELFTAFCNKLYKIELQGSLVNITSSGIQSIARNSGTLLSLSIISNDEDDGSVHSGSSSLSWNLDNKIFPALINNMTSKLRHFCLSGFNMLTIDGLEKFLSYFRKTLQSLDFSELNIMNDCVLKSIGDYCSSLFVLKLNHCKQITDQGIENLFQKTSSVEVLELCGCENITDECFKVISTQCSKLTVIKLDWCFSLTEKSLKLLAANCKRLSYVSMRGTHLNCLPANLSRLLYLNNLNVSDCPTLTFPGKNIIEKGLHEIRDALMDYDIENRIRVTALGSLQSGKTSILLSLQSDNNVADGPTFGVPVNMWFPFLGNSTISGLSQKHQESSPSLSVELWDCSGRKALQGLHAYFMCKQSIYLVCFNVSMYNQVDKVPKFVNTIQSKSPGATIILIASHCDLTKTDKVRATCERVVQKILEEEENQVREIKEELLFLRDLGLFAMISAKRRKLEWLLEHRPNLHSEVVCISSLTGEGVEKLRALVLSMALDEKANSQEGQRHHLQAMENVYFEIMKLKKENILFVTWSWIKTLKGHWNEMDEHALFAALGELNDMGCIMFMNEAYTKHQQNQILSSSKQTNELELPSDTSLFCIHPHVFAEAVAAVHRDEKNVQDLVKRLQREGHIDALWSGPKPNDWTLRTSFTHVTESGMIRESIVPLLVNTVVELSPEQLRLLINAMRELYVLMDGAPNANYDVELILPSMKNFGVFKRYFMPSQGLLPVIPQINAWLPKCPATHIQVGWDYRFVSSVPSNLFIYIISACTVIKENSETISYWQSGAYIRNGTVDISVCQWKDKLVLQVLARALISNSTRQAVNKAWSILAKYLYAIEMFLSLFPGLYYEVLALSNSHCKPILEVVDEYETGDITEHEALWDIPLKGCTRNTIRSVFIPPNYLCWLKSVSEQIKVHISHASNMSKELMSITSHLQKAGYEVSKDHGNEDDIMNARLIICLLTSSAL